MANRPRASSNRAALAGLRAAAGSVHAPPGAASPRLHGRYATATVAGVTLHLFDWELSWEMEAFDATAHGERWKVWVPGDQQWRVRCRGYFTRTVAAYLAAAANLTADPAAVIFTGYQNITPLDAANTLWSGAGFITRGSFSAPMAMITQEIEIQGTGIPTDISI